MKIAVCIKQVPARDSVLRVAPSGRWIEEDGLSYEINEPDAYALEEALQLKERHGGEVTVLCAGPARASQTIREALAKGADRAIHVEAEHLDPFNPLEGARQLAAAIRPEAPDLILTGLQSDDLNCGQTGVILAELLGLPHATIVMEVAMEDGTLRVRRELEGGWFQHIEMPLPAVLTVQSGSHKLRYATLMGIKKAKLKEIRRLVPEALAVAGAGGTVALDRLSLPERSHRSELFEGPGAAEKLVAKLKFEARVL